MLTKIQFTPNVPVLVALKFKDGKPVEGRFGDQMYYTFDHDRCAYLDNDVAAKINELEPKVGQPFEICKYWSGKKGDKPQWDVRWPGNAVSPLPPAGPSSSEWDEADDRKLHDQLQTSIDHVRNGRAAASAGTPPAAQEPETPAIPNPPAPTNGNNGQDSSNGNGTHGGNGNGKAETAASGLPTVPLKIPMDVAFDEILTWMTAALQDHHIQWNDASQQDFASTALIGGMREGWISPWRRRAA